MSTFLTTREAATLLRVTYDTVTKHCREGKLPAVRHAGRWRIRRAELLARLGVLQGEGRG